MDIELRFRKDDIETEKWVIDEFGVSRDDFYEIRSLDGTYIIIAVIIAIKTLIEHPEIIDKFLKRADCEALFDEEGNLLMAKGYSASEVIKMKAKNAENLAKPK